MNYRLDAQNISYCLKEKKRKAEEKTTYQKMSKAAKAVGDNAVWKLLEVSRYAKRWPLIAKTGELEASSVTVQACEQKNKKPKRFCQYQVSLHKRRVTESQAAGGASVHVWADCKEAFGSAQP